MATVLVTDASLGSAIAVIRSLGRAGHRVIAADHDRGSPGFRSRYAAARLLHERAATDPDGFVRRITEAVEGWGVDVVVPVTEEHLLPLIAVRDRLGAIVAAADADALEQTRDKLATVELARRLEVPVPETILVSRVDEGLEAGTRLGWPVVLKPRRSRVRAPDGTLRALEVTYANEPAELERRLSPLLEAGDVLLQRHEPGEAYGVELLLANGRPLAAFQHRRIHEVPFTGGASALRESVPLHPRLLSYATRLLGELGWTGLAMVEFKVDGDEARLLEINGRIWGSLPLAVKSGVDFPARYVDLLLNGVSPDAPLDCDYRIGVRSRNVGLELVWIASVLRGPRRHRYLPAPRRTAALRALAGLVRPSDEFDVLSLDDPRPGLADLWRAVRHLLRKAADRR